MNGRQQVPIVGPGTGRAHLSTALPDDLLAQMRRRVRVLSGLMFIALVIAPVWNLDAVGARPGFLVVNIAAAVASAALYLAARSGRVTITRLFVLGLAYEVVLCFLVSLGSFWSHWIERGYLPEITWVPAILFFVSIVLLTPPARALAGQLLAGATPLLALLVLSLRGDVVATLGDYLRTAVDSAFAIVFAQVAARIVFGLGRQVAAARALGSYHLQERLAQGGMGEVWRARHELLARPAAIKLVRPPVDGVDHATQQRRFEREAQAIATLRSPHTVELFDFGIAENGSFFYAMELLDGMDAQALVRRHGPLPAARVIHILAQVCHSLSEAHGRGLIHRDIKPANVFVCKYGEDHDFVKVLDFGLVKDLDRAVAEPPGEHQTGENTICGTPAFMAPEQALGRTDLDGRVDIYSTGCLAYWLLTGAVIFSGKTAMEIIMHHTHTPPAPLSTRTELPISAALEALVLSCLAKNPDERPPSAQELRRRLLALEGAGAWTEDRARQWWTTHGLTSPSGSSR